MNLIDFISKKLHHSKYYDVPPDSDRTKLFLRFGSLILTFEGIQCVIKERRSGCLNDEIRDIFIDFINLHHGFGSSTLSSLPFIYAVNVFGIIQLFKFSEYSSSNHHKLSLDDKYFEIILKNFISSGDMVSLIASLLHLYKQNPDQNHKLTKFYGNLYVKNSHYVSVIIDTQHHLVQTCDSFNNNNDSFTNTVTLMRKWIAKMMSIIDCYINETNQDKNISYGSEDIRFADEMLDDDYDS